MIRAADLIEKKRDGEEHSADEISALIDGYNTGSVPDYQMAAWCMAVFFRGLSGRETYALTDAFIRSGETLDLGAMLGRRVVDKHSTGGVGDKTSIAVGPIVAACGVPFGKMSGRGLGHTGGTLDKLESIPGFRVELTTDEFVAQVRDVGLAIIGTTANLVPADKNLYGLRDVTATVDIVPLIASSIMSKKIAAGADAIVLDVKVGDGAFMKTLDDARILADQMVDLGRRAGREVVCLLTDMEQPLGYAVGNALEIREAIATITGKGPPDFTELVLDACARLLSLSDLELDLDEGRRRAEAGDEQRIRARGVRAVDPGPGRRPRSCAASVGAGGRGGHGAARGRRLSVGRPRSGHRGPRARRRPATQGGRGRPLGRRPAARKARRRGRRGGRARGDPRSRRRSRRACGRGRARRVRARGRDAPGARDPPRRRGVALVPELPEVETIRGQLAPRLEGRTFAVVDILDPRLTRPLDPREVAAELQGERVVAVERRGKYLVVRLEGGGALLVHLRMTGSFGFEPTTHERAVVELEDGSRLVYRDVRRFGTWLVVPGDELEPYIGGKNGPEPLGERFTAAWLGAQLARRRAPLKAVVLDQRVVAGLGNIYADEALWRARLSPLRAANGLDDEEVARLHRAIRAALRLGIERQGSTLRDYAQPDGSSGEMQDEFRVYGREGEPCPRCRAPIAKARVGGRGTWYCPSCQPLP